MIESKDIYYVFEDKNHLLPSIAQHLRLTNQIEPENLEAHIEAVLQRLRENEGDRHQLSFEVHKLIRMDGLSQILSESGINSKSSFWQELFSKLRHKLLPPLKTTNNFRFRLHRIFEFEVDYAWLQKINATHLKELISLLDPLNPSDKQRLQHSLSHALKTIAIRAAAIGSEGALGLRFHKPDEHQRLFFLQSIVVQQLADEFESKGEISETTYAKAYESVNKCLEHLERSANNSEVEGADINKTFLIAKCRDLLNRQLTLIQLTRPESDAVKSLKLHELLSLIAEEEFSKTSLSSFAKNNLKVLSLRISDHKSKTGEHYIAQNFRDYHRFLIAATGAGLIVSVLVFVKAWMHEAHFAPFWEAMAYSLNYIVGFVLIQLFHFTLATKQPAMTAASLAQSLQERDGMVDTKSLSLTIARVWHTQTVSFIGNLIVVFPLPFVLAWLMDVGFGYRLFDQNEAFRVVQNQHPWHSGAIWFAAITGFYLFISGLIAGYVDNRVIYSRIPERIKQHKGFRRFFGLKNTVKFSNFIDEHAGSLAGNISLGLFLGTATFIGTITGFPFDIRHITFAAGSFTSALYYTDMAIPLSDLIIVTLGILGIGFINFTVSFGAAFYVACKSRGVSIRQTPDILSDLYYYFKKKPQDFFVAPLHKRSVDEVFSDQKG